MKKKILLSGYSFSHLPIVVARFFSDGIASNDMKLHREEKEHIFKEVFHFLLHFLPDERLPLTYRNALIEGFAAQSDIINATGGCLMVPYASLHQQGLKKLPAFFTYSWATIGVNKFFRTTYIL